MVRFIEEDHDEASATVQDTLIRGYLTLLVEDRLSHTFPLKGEVRLGREKHNAVVVSDQKVSRHHATLTPVETTYLLLDQGSANGTYINGVRISQPTRLKDQDRLTFGDTMFLFTTRPPEAKEIKQSAPPPLSLSSLAPTSDQTNNRPIWMVIGCMAVVIITLLVIVALLLGIFVGRSQTTGLALWWLLSVI